MDPDSSRANPRGYRFQAGLPAALREGNAEHPCTAHDLSRTGVLLVGRLPRPAGGEVAFAIRSLAGDLEERFRGIPTRVETGEKPDELRIAVEFLPLDDGQRSALEILIARVMEGMAPAPIESLPPGAPPQAVRKALDAVPVPHRIALAARAGAREREILRQDANPQVLEALARNPNLLLAEARALASSAHLLPSTLEVLASDPRWAKDEEIRVAVATHARVSVPVGERLIAGLAGPALRRVLSRPSLLPALRDKALKKLAGG